MAATDQTYRNQKTVDIVFAVSCILMLFSVVWMFAQDYYRPFKVEIRQFRDVEEAMADRAALDELPEYDTVQKAEADVEEAQGLIDQKKVAQIKAQVLNEVLPKKAKAEADYQATKADYDSLVSLYNIEVDEHGEGSAKAKEMKGQIGKMEEKLGVQQAEAEKWKAHLDALQKQQAELERPLTEALVRLKKIYDSFDRVAKNAVQKRWKVGDVIRSLPVIDGFASPYRIHQYTLNDLPIDYNFKQVTRYDRCVTCHQGIERGAYTKEALRDLTRIPAGLNEKLKTARAHYLKPRQRLLASAGEKLSYDPGELELRAVKLSEAHINEFAAHPRLDLFVDANSPHGAEKFGCTICHSGQGSATSFAEATHTPNGAAEKKRWRSQHDWAATHYWDFPMLPKRFLEASCVKCHHQMTDLVREGSRVEAPKLMRGYNLVRENGCFGCHEIAGLKGGRAVGPDLRLEPYPALENLSPEERAKALADPLNPPGAMRKVGPSLRRLTEKTNEDWVRKWVRAPRDFRPDTKMPHFYGLSNNTSDALPEDQKDFPDAEINSIAYFLFQRSKGYLDDVKKHMKDPVAERQKAQQRYEELYTKPPSANPEEKQKVQKELDDLARKILLWSAAPPIADLPLPEAPKDREAQVAQGRKLFSERGCLACHIHAGTTTPQGKPDTADFIPPITSDAHFGPNLTRLAAKLGTKPGDRESARRWLVQWILDPRNYHPRTFMPVTQLTPEQADAIAAWLLSRDEKWDGPKVEEPKIETLRKLTRVHLEKTFTRQEVNEILERDRGLSADQRKYMRADADEQELSSPLDESKLKLYIGKKAIGQLGCYACHDIPGFETAKPIGTPLNDWGKKDPERLAFEDIKTYVNKHFYVAGKLTKDKGEPRGVDKDGKRPYEQFFYEALIHEKRDGFLHQKLLDPRSYDYARLRRWDERLRMPQFRFARTEKHANESEEAYEDRRYLEEAEAREAVMTFILGLVAEPVPAKFVYDPPPDKRAEVKGRQVLDKFNCTGCHQVRPGVYEFKPTPLSAGLLDANYETAKASFASDHRFLNNNAWVAPPSPRPDRLTAYGILAKNVEVDEQLRTFLADRGVNLPDNVSSLTELQLTQALRFTGTVRDKEGKESKEVKELPASSSVLIPPQLMLSQAETYGGTYANLLSAYLMDPRLPERFRKNEGDARASGPPPLFREGEKAQPGWLYQFLRNPHEIRPMTTLRMPRFSLSEEEAMALVNYFAAVDKVNDPAMGVTYPYLTVPQRQDEYLRQKTAEYVERLKKDEKQYKQRLDEMNKVWDGLWKTQGTEGLKRQRAELEARMGEAEKARKDAENKKAETLAKQAEKEINDLKQQIEGLKDEGKQRDAYLKSQLEQWTTRDAYLQDGYRLLASQSATEKLCLNCHRLGNLGPPLPNGPQLDIAWERLRPEWTERWIANPLRFLYRSPMPQNFPANKTAMQELFLGNSLQQSIATRDALMNYPRLADLAVIRAQTAPAGTGGK